MIRTDAGLVILTSRGFILWCAPGKYITCGSCGTVKAVVENRDGATYCDCGGRINGSKVLSMFEERLRRGLPVTPQTAEEMCAALRMSIEAEGCK